MTDYFLLADNSVALRPLIPRKAGRPKRRVRDAHPDGFTFAA
jgi:hypothetical protein